MRKALAIDLDGTLLSTNTFRDYLSFCGRAAVHRFRFDMALGIAWWVILRKLRLISHSSMKAHTLRLTAVFMQRNGQIDLFVERELLLLNTRVQQFMEQYRNRGHMLILCTAAPAIYAHPIAENLHIDFCCATPLPSEIVIGQWCENVGQNKVQSLSRMLKVHKAELDVVITDHHDDLPLLDYNEGSNFVVAPSAKTLQLLKQHCQQPYQVI